MRIKLFPLLLIAFLSCKENNINEPQTLKRLAGPVFGTSYSIIYESERNYRASIDSIYDILNRSLSTYKSDSDISKLNRNEDYTIDNHFINVFRSSKEIYSKTDGAFDPTIGAVVNAWNFGPEGNIVEIDSILIDSLMTAVGLNRVQLRDNKVIKPENTYLDFNAIAKGYAVDVIAEFLDDESIGNYLVEIGGEIRVKGLNIEKGEPWKVGIEEPRFDGEQSIMKSLMLKDESMATSGVYRKFKIDDQGNRYSHIIDTQTGYPSKTNILSVTVIAPNCMVADGYATAFKSMGITKINSFLETNRDLKAFIIFENEEGQFDTLYLNDFPE